MGKSAALITVRSGSTRLPNKCFKTITEDLSAIQIVINRVKKVGCKVILCTSEDSQDDALSHLAKIEKIECFRGSKQNKIKRWYDCFLKFNLKNSILVDGDDLTFDFNIAKRSLDFFKSNSVELIVGDSAMMPGFFTYAISLDGISKLFKLVKNSDSDTDVITGYLKLAQLKKGILKSKQTEKNKANVRLTLDYEEDLEFYRQVYSKISYLAPGPEVVNAILKNHLEKINWHKNQDFLENQRRFNEKITDQNQKIENYE
tara:strand:+ start:214 stop:990 length:777 start_codon:yes stop_codon:yes gene_type:complete